VPTIHASALQPSWEALLQHKGLYVTSMAMMNEKKSQALESEIDDVRKFRFCGPSDDPDEQTAVTSGFRHLIIQLKRLAGPILPANTATQLAAINVEVNDLYSAYDANAEISPLLFDIEEALEAAKSSNLITTAGTSSDLPFSRRNNYAPNTPPEITIREDAPEYVRMLVIDTPLELGFRPGCLREIVCRVLRERPDPDNWSEFPNVWGEVEGLTYGCPWFKVYGIIEAIYKAAVLKTTPSLLLEGLPLPASREVPALHTRQKHPGGPSESKL
jgi:hypothetical protein